MTDGEAETRSDRDPTTLPFCDIIMKGGITSGVVYPHAVLELKKSYRFKSIGGTSAGAIAAAMAAAAEHNRAHGGFEALAAATDEISTSLFDLFQPATPFRGLFAVLMAAVDRSRGARGRIGRVLGALVGHHAGQTVAGLLPGLVVLVLAAAGGRSWEAWVLGALAAILGLVLAWALCLLVPLLKDLPGHGFGLCPGMGTDPGRPALTAWLADTLDEIAGHKRPGAPATDEPLTFGHLIGPDPAAPELNLKIMTTDLTTGRPHCIPFGSRELMFSVSAFTGLFPPRIVRHMIDHSLPFAAGDEDIRYLPPTDRLPVVVAVRLSLSFPVLLAAVPLLSRDWTLRDPVDGATPRPCWFSDGGICSNFPIHFFDSPWPRWPTFGIMLDEWDEERYRTQVWMPQTAAQGRLGRFRTIGSLPAFLGAIISTMQNWRDNGQCVLPGYRERIVRIALKKEEGGLNLHMAPPTIRRLFDLGREAGKRVVSDFDFEAHRWRRYLGSQGPLAEMFDRMGTAWDDDQAGRTPLREFLPRYAEQPAEYKDVPTERLLALVRTSQAVVAATADWSDLVGPIRDDLPRPRAVMRLVPPV